MLLLIGLGLSESEISLRGLDKVKTSDSVYLEAYTSKMDADLLRRKTGIDARPLKREDLEENQAKLLEESYGKNVALLVPGDPLAATTHVDLVLECRKRGIPVEIVHSSSIFTAVAETGLQLYKFGRTVTIPYPDVGYAPRSFLDHIKQNQDLGLHTLCLLDVKPPRYMTVKEALEFLYFSPVIAAHFGERTVIKYGSREKLMKEDIPTPSAVIVPGNLHEMEAKMLDFYKV